MSEEMRQSLEDFNTNLSPTNQLRFFIEQTVRDILSTASLVRVDSTTGGGVAPAGTVSGTPLVAQTDAWGNILPMSPIPRMPFFRYQAGKAAFIVDPVPGDQGVAVFCKGDSSNVGVGTQEPVRPASFRLFDQADGMFFGGTQNQTPTVWIEIKQDETITIHAPAGCTIETDENVTVNAGKAVNVTAGESVSITAPEISLNGALATRGQSGGATTARLTGSMTVSQDVTASGISLDSHIHSGVQPGSGSSGQPR
jgi:phage baseplate assembly protein gpV